MRRRMKSSSCLRMGASGNAVSDVPDLANRLRRSTEPLCARAALVAMVAALTLPMLVAGASAQAPAGFTASFVFSPAAPAAGEPVTFTSTSSVVGNAVIVREAWDFNGDGLVDSSGPSATHTFTSAGVHRVTLTVQDSRGRSRTASRLVTVAAAPAPPSSAAPVAGAPPPTSASSTPSPSIVPFPVVRITGSYSRHGVRLQRLWVTTPIGVRITVRCVGRGCPFRQRGPFVVLRSASQRGATRLVRIKGFSGRLLRPGSRFEVLVADRQRIGKYTYFRVRRTKPPARVDRCLRPGGASVISCP
jgi:plastocyanin